jgi:serine protease Do
MARLFSGAPARGRVLLVGSCAVVGALVLSSRGAGHPVAPATLADVVARVDSGVLRVETRSCGKALLGTGFLIDSRHVATAEHVVDGATRIALKQGSRTVGAGTIVGADPVSDVALVRTDAPIHGHVFSLSKRGPRMSEDVAALGFPLGRPMAVARGFVRGTATTIPAKGSASHQLIQTDAAVDHGDSGGPLVSVTDGAVLGLVNLSSVTGGGPSFAVSARIAAPLLSRWRSDPEAVPQRQCNEAAIPPLAEPGRPLG